MRSVLIAVVLLCATCSFAQSDSESVKQALLKADRDFNAATQERRLDGWMEYMADTGVVERGTPVVGKDAVRAALNEDWANPNFHLTWEPEEAYAMPGNKMGYTRGNWTLNSVDEKKQPYTLTGKYLTIWRLNKQGQWKIIWDGGSANPPKAH